MTRIWNGFRPYRFLPVCTGIFIEKAFLSLVHNAILHQTTGKVMSLGMKQFFIIL